MLCIIIFTRESVKDGKLQRIFEMAIGYVVKHNRLPMGSLLFSRRYPVLAEEGVEVGAVDVDFAAYL